MEVAVAVAFVCVFIAGYKSAGSRVRRVENHTDYRIDFTYDKATDTVVITGVFADE